MSDDLTPAEQARAARWAKGWLLKCEFVESETAQDAMRALGYHAERMDPPESVESLRAERDKTLADVAHYKEQFRLVCDESKERLETVESLQSDCEELAVRLGFERAETARLRATHAEQIEDMKARWLKDARERSTDLFLAKNPLPSSEAARGRCSRED